MEEQSNSTTDLTVEETPNSEQESFDVQTLVERLDRIEAALSDERRNWTTQQETALENLKASLVEKLNQLLPPTDEAQKQVPESPQPENQNQPDPTEQSDLTTKRNPRKRKLF